MLSSALLFTLMQRWREAGADIASALQPGLTCQQIHAITSPIGLAVPAEAIDWWRFLNVNPQDSRRKMTSGWHFLRLDEAIEQATEKSLDEDRLRVEAGLSDTDGPLTWKSGWLPLAWSSHQGLLVIDCARVQSGPVPVFYTEFDMPDKPGVRSLGEMVSWWIEAFETGAYYFDPELDTLLHKIELLPRQRELTRIV